jgi:alkanesulfonate monooxygenase SsuD/methylene tetrahydromethanopterin reductase-like flavin-dependent oxidoreductase (luciferase family)
VRYAISVPNFGDFADPGWTLSLAREAESAGWDAFFLWDHLLAWNGNVVADPWTLLAAIAVSTERIRVGTMVTPLPRRRPWQVARQVVTLDRLSGGRAVLGVGLGFPPREEFERFGESGDTRVRAEMLDEGLEIVAGLMGGGPLTHEGRHFHLDDVTFAPLPEQRPRVPIWVAGAWPNRAPFRRAARFDGVVPIALVDGQEVPIDVPTMRAVVDFTDRCRRGEGPFDRVFTGILPDDPVEARTMADQLASFGVTWWQVSPEMGQTREEVSAWIRRGPPTAGEGTATAG